MRILLLSRGDRTSNPAGHQVQGFAMYARELRDELGLEIVRRDARTPDEIAAVLADPPRIDPSGSGDRADRAPAPQPPEPSEPSPPTTDPQSATEPGPGSGPAPDGRPSSGPSAASSGSPSTSSTPHAPDRFDAAIVLAHWSHAAEDIAAALARRDRGRIGRVALMDYYAPTSTPHFPLAAEVDLYLKRQVLTDRSLYERDYAGGSIFSDFVTRHWGYDLGGWHFGSVIPPGHGHKIAAAWNLGVARRYRALLRATGRVSLPWRLRPIELNARVGLVSRAEHEQWYQFSRRKCLEALRPVVAKRRSATEGRVPPKRYYAELLGSRVVVSPFGWGEVCFRDYEAVACGALLIKPDMSHVETRPDIYRAGETYVPCRWDFADLAERCEHYLSRPAEALAIVRRARAVLGQYYEHGGFVGEMRAVLERLRPVHTGGAEPAAPPARSAAAAG